MPLLNVISELAFSAEPSVESGVQQCFEMLPRTEPTIPLGLERETATTLLTARSFGDFHLSLRRYPEGCVLPPHVHDQPYVTFVLSGSFVQLDDAGKREHVTGAVVLYGTGAHHSDTFGSSGGRDLNVRLPASWFSSVTNGEVAHLAGTPQNALRATTRLLAELHTPDDVTPLVVESVLLETVAALRRMRSAAALPHWLDAARKLVDSSFRDNLQLRIVADEVGVHPVHLARSFRRHFGVSVGERIRELRFAAACKLLTETRMPIAEVALSCAFSDQSHLHRMFVLRLGMTPRQFRLLHG
jgi:AraC family transcriptional regulator